MRKAWRISGRGITAAIMTAATSPASSEPVPPTSSALAAEGRKQRFRSYLTRNMATAIAAIIVEERDANSPPETGAGSVERG